MAEIQRCPECEEMQKSHKDYCIWCSAFMSDEPVKNTDELNCPEKPDSSERGCSK